MAVPSLFCFRAFRVKMPKVSPKMSPRGAYEAPIDPQESPKTGPGGPGSLAVALPFSTTIFEGLWEPILSPSWTPLGPILGPSWAVLGPSWAHLGPILGHLGPLFGYLAPILGLVGAILWPSWDFALLQFCLSFVLSVA